MTVFNDTQIRNTPKVSRGKAGKVKKKLFVCRECHRVVDGASCSICGTTNLSTDWTGYLVIIDPEHSEVAKRMNITLPGRYALKVR